MDPNYGPPPWTRLAFLAGITTNPNGEWVTQCARTVTEDLRSAGVAVWYLLRDRDDKVGPGFDAVWQSEGASVVLSPVRAPNANAVAERWMKAYGAIRVHRSSSRRHRGTPPTSARLLRPPLQRATSAPRPGVACIPVCGVRCRRSQRRWRASAGRRSWTG